MLTLCQSVTTCIQLEKKTLGVSHLVNLRWKDVINSKNLCLKVICTRQIHVNKLKPETSVNKALKVKKLVAQPSQDEASLFSHPVGNKKFPSQFTQLDAKNQFMEKMCRRLSVIYSREKRLIVVICEV